MARPIEFYERLYSELWNIKYGKEFDKKAEKKKENKNFNTVGHVMRHNMGHAERATTMWLALLESKINETDFGLDKIGERILRLISMGYTAKQVIKEIRYRNVKDVKLENGRWRYKKLKLTKEFIHHLCKKYCRMWEIETYGEFTSRVYNGKEKT